MSDKETRLRADHAKLLQITPRHRMTMNGCDICDLLDVIDTERKVKEQAEQDRDCYKKQRFTMFKIAKARRERLEAAEAALDAANARANYEAKRGYEAHIALNRMLDKTAHLRVALGEMDVRYREAQARWTALCAAAVIDIGCGARACRGCNVDWYERPDGQPDTRSHHKPDCWIAPFLAGVNPPEPADPTTAGRERS